MTASSPQAGTTLPVHVFDLCAPERVFFNTESALDGTMTNLQLYATIPPEFQWDGRAFLWRDGSFVGSVSNQVTVTGTNLLVDLEGESMELGDELEVRLWIVSPCYNFPVPEGTVVDFDFVWELAEDPGQCYSIDLATAQLTTEAPAILPAWNPASPQVAPGECFTWIAEVANEGFGDAYGVNGQFTLGPALSFTGISAIRVAGVASTNINYAVVTNGDGSVTVTFDTDEVIPGASDESNPNNRKIEFDLEVCSLNCDVAGMTGNLDAEAGCFEVLCDSASSEASVVLVYDTPVLVEDVTFSSEDGDGHCFASYPHRYSVCKPLQISSVLTNDSTVVATNVSYTWRMWAVNSQNQFLDNVSVVGSDPGMNITVTTQTFADEGGNEMVSNGYGNEIYLITYTVDRIEPGEFVTLFAEQVPTCPFGVDNDVTSSNYLRSWWGQHHRRTDRFISWRDSCGALIEDDHLTDDIEQWRALVEFPHVSSAKVQGTPILGAGECGVIQPSFQVPWWAIVEHCDEGVSVRFTLPATLEWGGSDIVMSNENLSVSVANLAEGVDFTYDPITRTFDIPINDTLRDYGYCASPFYNLTIPICVADPCIGGLYEIPIEWFGGSCCGCEYRIAIETMPITVVCPGCECGVAAGEITTERPVNGVVQEADKGLPGDLLTYTDSFSISGGNDTCCLTNMTWRHQSWSLIGDARANYDDPVLVYQPGSTMITITRANGAVENYSFDPACLNNAPAHPDDGDGDGTGDASGYCDWDFGAQGITLCGGDQVSVKFEAQVNCYGATPANENILDWAFSLTSGFDKDVAGRSCGPNAHFYDLVKYWLSTWQPYFSENGTGSWIGADGQPTETCQRKQYMVARYVQRDDEPGDPFPDEDREYLTNSVLTVNLAPGLIYDPDPDAYIWVYTRASGWQQPTDRIPPVITPHPAGGQTLTWDMSNLTDTNGVPVVFDRSEYHEVRVYYAVRPLCDFQQGSCVDLNGDGDCGDLNTVWDLYDSCGRLRSSQTSGGLNLNWDATLDNARGDLTSTMSPVLQNSSTRELNCWTLQINNIGNGTAWNTWTYLDIADDIVIDTITDLDTGLPLPVWYVTNDANDVYLELGDLAPFNGRGLLRICGHLEDTNGDGDACDTGFFGQERGVTATTFWGCEFSDAPPDIDGLEICETVQSEVTIRLLPANLQVEKSINDGDPITLCEEFPNRIRMLNTGFTDGFNIRMVDLPPPGVFINTNTIVMWITDANGVRTQITSCTVAPTQLSTFGTGVNERQLIRWDMCPELVIERGGVFEIEYMATTTCEFISGRPSRVFPSFEAPCGQRIFLPNGYISPVSVLAGNQNADFSAFEVNLTPINGDGCGVGDVEVTFVNNPGAFPDGNPATDLQVIQVLPPGIHYLPGSVSVGPIGGATVTNPPTAYCVEWDLDGNPVFTHNGETIELRSGIVAGQEVLIFDMDDLEPGESGSLTYQYRADVNCVADGRVHYSLIRYNSPMDCPNVAGGTCAEIQFENQRSVPLIERRPVVPVVETHDAEILCLGEQIEFTINAQNTGNGWADNFSMFHTFDPTILTPVSISDGGIVTNYGLIEWVSGITSLTDTDGDGLADELASGAPIKTDGSPLTVVFEFTGPLGCNTHRVTTNRSFAAWGCDNQPSIAGCPAPVGSEGGKVCGIPDAIVEPTDLLCPELSLEKTTQGVDADIFEEAPAILVGDTVTWIYAISNSGNTAMHNFSVVDTEEGAVTCAEGAVPVLQPGEVFLCTLEAPQVCGPYDNLATVTGSPVLSDCVRTASDPSHYFGVCPDIDLEKATQGMDADSAPGPYVEVGDMVTWTYTLVNQGNVALNVTSLVDNVIGVIAIPSPVMGDANANGLLDLTEIWTIDVTAVATTAGQYMNTADVLADPVQNDGTSYGFPPVTDADPSHYFGAMPGIDIEKFTNGQQADTPSGPVIQAGDLVHWTYQVSNTGNVPLAGIPTSVVDSNEGVANYVMGDADNDLLLDINEVWQFEIFGAAIPGQYSNNVDVVGDPVDENGNQIPDIEDVRDQDPSHYFGADPMISLQKTVYYGHDGGASCGGDELEINVPGAPVTYCFIITNTGNTSLSPIGVNDPALGFTTSLAVLLPPGGSVTTHVESVIAGDLINTASTFGVPTDDTGTPLADVDNPTDENDAAVDEVTPGVQIIKTDYTGHDGGAGCPGGELAYGVLNADVTYCFQVINTGNTYLVDIIVTDDDITPPYSMTVPGPIAPGGSVSLFTERTMTADLVNTASVTADPSDDAGEPFDDIEDVTDDDDAEVDVVAPSITLAKTVYATHNGGASCPGSELVQGVPNGPVTYCFVLTNTGDTHLDTVTVTDNDLSPTFMHTFAGVNLSPGGVVTTYVETVINGDLVNTADASGNPTDVDGNDLVGVEDVTAEDPAAVVELVPAIGIEKTVYYGHDGGASCAGDELEINLTGAPVTYCFVVTNSGETYLSPVVINDPALGFNTSLNIVLAPGATVTSFVESTISGDLVNTAETSGNPADDNGDDLPGGEDPTDEDDAAVDEVNPGVQIIKTDYTGHDGGAGCPGGELAFGVLNADVTYCFQVINTGTTYLVDIIVTDNDITPPYSMTVPGPIAPGGSVSLFTERTMTADLVNTASVTADPSDDAGEPLDDMEDVTDDDDAEVDVVTPRILLFKTVFEGHSGSCPGVELVVGVPNGPVTYCFEVINNGDTYLDNITLVDNNLSPVLNHSFAGVNLAPGESLYLSVLATIDGDLLNTAETTGNPTDEDGNDLAGVDDVDDQDTAEVDELVPDIGLEKTVYYGHDGGASCQGAELEVNVPGAPVTYCFVVTNSGETYLSPIIINDPALGYNHVDFGVILPPGGIYTTFVETVIAGDLVNIASVSGTPVDEIGDGYFGSEDVTDEDDAAVDEIRPGIELLKTGYNGHDGGSSCAGTDLAFGVAGDDVTYCFEIVNTGNTYLVDIQLVDIDISPAYSHNVPGPIAPGERVFLHVETTMLANLINTASVSADPSDDSGVPYDDVDEVSDDDPAEVQIVEPGIAISKTVYNGHDSGTSCAGVEAVTNLYAGDVTYCFVVENTGDTHLDTITVSDFDVSPIFTHVFTGVNLAPGGTVTTHVERVILGDLQNTADVSGNPTDGNGDDLTDVDDVMDNDPADVDMVEPGIELVKTVYIGHDAGASCPGSDYELNVAGQTVTYCFEVINTGDTYLNPVIVDDPAIGYTSGNLGNFAPGASITVHVETVMSADLTNVAEVAGNPANEDGSDIPDMDDATDDDPAEVDVETPAIDLVKTVYSGWDGGGSCALGVDLLHGLAGEQITYCFVVSNSGSAFLTDVTVTDNMITPPFSQTITGQLAPGESVVLYTQTTLDTDLVNTAEVAGTMSDANGNPVEDPNGNPITVGDDDPAEVDLVGPGIELYKSVYEGHDGGASCEGQQLLVDTNGTPVTYCFVVENTGNTWLDMVTIDDPALGYMHTFTGVNLAPGATLTNHVEVGLLVDLLNIADASGNPTDEDGNDLTNVVDVTDDDPAEVEAVRVGIDLQKTVYAGWNNGALCPTAGDLVFGVNGDEITYCFKIINTGTTYIVNATVTDNDITPNYSGVVAGPIPPGGIAYLHVQTSLMGDLVNTASVTGAASDGDGNTYPEIPALTDEDPAEVDEVGPSIAITKTVYNGHDSGVSCAGVEAVTNLPNADVTYCFVVSNTGDTYLDDITVSDTDISPSFSHTFTGLNLAPGGSATTYVERVVDGDLVNIANASGNPTDENGDDLDNLDEVTDDDSAEVDEVSPGIELVKTVYLGHDGGASCPGSDYELNTPGTLVTYCFEVINTGDTFLNPVVVDDPLIGYNSGNLGLLAPGDRLMVHAESAMTADLTNLAEVVGNPSNEDGSDIPDTDDVSDDDPAEVDTESPAIAISKTVYSGWDGGGNCPGSERLVGLNGEQITYCFVVSNTGSSYLTDVTVTDNMITPAFSQTITGELAPGESVVLFTQILLQSDLVNTAEVVGTMSDEDGNPVENPNGDPVTVDDADDAEVDLVGPGIELSKTVYDAHDGGASCQGQELLVDTNGAPVTYCFVVENTGDTHLNTITIGDPALGYTHVFTGVNLAPGGTLTNHIETTLLIDLVNIAEASGNPTDENGTDIPLMEDVTDDDPAEVVETQPGFTLEKTVYAGHSNGNGCPTAGELVNGVNGDDITYCFQFVNTGNTYLINLSVSDTDIMPNFSGTVPGPIAPGGVAWLFTERQLDGDLVNTASATATPSDDSGNPYEDIPVLEDEDDAEVDEHAPSLEILKSVYNGHDSGASCSGVESVTNTAMAAVTYCFVVVNTGNTYLNDITVTDNDLDPNFSHSFSGVNLAPGASVTTYVDSVIDGDLMNTADASGNPTDENGDDLDDVEDVEDNDTAEVDEMNPVMEIAKTVYYGHDGGLSCDGTEVHVNTLGAPVTYCFVVVNTGDTWLDTITVVDNDLSPAFTNVFSGLNLAPGASVTTHTETVISAALVNTAQVTGNPTTASGEDIPDTPDVGDEDTAEVDPVAPGVAIQKTVYAGHNNGASCAAADELAYSASGGDVTYCFHVTNTGDTYLNLVTVTDSTVSPAFIGQVPYVLAPNQSAWLFAERIATADFTNTASVTGTPSDPAGNFLPDVPMPEDEDDAEVDVVAPAMNLAKTVYLGHDNGASCPGGESVTNANGAAVTYCFVVSNTGDTWLDNITITDLDLDPVFVHTFAGLNLAPGASVTTHTETVIDGDLENSAEASGNPTDENGDDMPEVDDVDDEDTADVDAVIPSITISKTVYNGHNGGTSCPGTDLHVNVVGTQVTYCFEVINTGDTVLNPVTLNDPSIPNFAALIQPAASVGPLAPNDSAWFYLETTLDADLVNTAEASGNPSNPDGSDIPNLDDPSAEDIAEVETVAPAIDIQKTVYSGHNGGMNCPTAVDHLDVLGGEAITYCFRITNSGNTPLTNVAVTDNLVIPAFSGTLPFVLQPGQSAWLHTERTAVGTITNIASVTGTPSDPSGEELPEVDVVTDEDEADITVSTPSIELAKTVYNGHDAGASCDNGVESVTNLNGAAVTYCFVVVNTGDTWLNRIEINDTDLEPDFRHIFSVNLAPGASITTYTETVLSGDLENTAEVGGNPTDETGLDLPNLDEVSDDDTADVDEISPSTDITKTVYLGHDGGVSCPGTDLLINLPGALVTYCFEVTNTGDTYLDPVLVADTDLDPDFFSLNLGPLAPGQSVTTHHQSVLSGDLVNTASATGNPITPSGEDIPEVDDTTDEDMAEVDEQTPSIDLQKTVYLGWNLGGGCPGSESVSGNHGDLLTYCFQITNDGDANLVNVVLTDNDIVPPFSQVIPMLEPGETATLFTQRTLDQDILNTAGVKGTMADENGTPVTDDNGDPITTGDQDTAEVDVRGPAINLSKTVYEGHNGGASCEGVETLLVNVGTPVTWCFLIQNTGDTHLSPVVINDTDLDPAVQIIVPGILAPGQTYTGFVERTAVNLMNTASVTGDPVDENGTPLDDVDSVTSEDVAEVRSEDFDLALEKTVASAGPFAPGDTISFTIIVRNEGSIAAQNVLVEDRPPVGLTLADPAWTISGSSAERIIAGPIAPGGQESYTISFTIDSDAGGTLENRAEIASAEDTTGTPRDDIDSTADSEPGDPEDEDDEDGDTFSVERFDLALTKKLSSVGPFAPGDSVTYSLLVTNQGNVAAQNILLTDSIPDGLTLTDPNWTDLGLTAVGTVAGPLAPGAALSVDITFTIDADSSGRMVNVAEISGASGPDGDPRDDIDSTFDGDAGNDGPVTDNATNGENGDEDDHDIEAIDIDVFDLALMKTLASSGPFAPGGDITFTLTVHNQGDVVATAIALSDYIPAGISLNDAAWTETAGIASAVLAGPIQPGATASMDITFTIDPGVSGPFENAAEISAAADADGNPRDDIDSTSDTDPTNDGPVEDDALDSQNGDEDDHDTAPFEVGSFDLALRKTLLGNGPWEAGDVATFRITVFNQGDVTAQRVLLRDTIPAGLSLDDPAWTDNNDGTASYLMGGPIVPGGSAFVDIRFEIDPGFSGNAGNIAEIESAEDTEGNPRDDIDGTFDADPDNDGDVTDDDINGTGEPDSDEDNHDRSDLFVDAFDLALVKTLNSTRPFTAGDDLVFTITVHNQGNLTAHNVQVMDHLPAGLVLNDPAWQSIGTSGASRFITGPIAPGASESVTLTATVASGMSGTLENFAEIAEAEDADGSVRDDVDSRPDTNVGNDGPITDDALLGENGDEDDSDIATVDLEVFDLALTKSLSGPGPYASGDLVTYTVTVYNQGTLPASAITIVDYIPASLTLSDSDWTASPGNTATITLDGPIAPGASALVDITCRIVPGTLGDVVNQAEISSALDGAGVPRSDIDSTFDNDPTNDGPAINDNIVGTNGDEDDHDIATLTVQPFDLALRKALDGSGPFFVGDTVTYSITIYNQGALAATEVMVTDYLPTGLELADSNWTVGANNIATAVIPGPIAPGGEAVITISCLIQSGASGDLQNIAEITAMHDSEGNAQQDIDSVPDSDPDNDGFMVDDEIDNGGNDEDDHDPAMLTITPLGSIGDTVWVDLSNDGDPSNEQLSELGLEGVEVYLYEVVNGVSKLVATAITGPNGYYQFDDLKPGDYVVEVDQATVPESVPLLTTDSSYPITLAPGEQLGSANFGFTAPPTAVELEFFQASLTPEGVQVVWRTAYESDVLGFYVYRIDPTGPTKINAALMIAGQGDYSVVDPDGIGGTYVLEEVTTDLAFEVVANALTHKDAKPVAGETLVLASEDGRIELTTSAAHRNLLLTGFDSHPRVTDETHPNYPVELIGERLETTKDKGVYLSVDPNRAINATIPE